MRDLAPGDGWRLVDPNLGTRRTGHSGEVRIQPVEVDDESRRIQILNRGSCGFLDRALHGGSKEVLRQADQPTQPVGRPQFVTKAW